MTLGHVLCFMQERQRVREDVLPKLLPSPGRVSSVSIVSSGNHRIVTWGFLINGETSAAVGTRSSRARSRLNDEKDKKLAGFCCASFRLAADPDNLGH